MATTYELPTFTSYAASDIDSVLIVAVEHMVVMSKSSYADAL